NNNPLCASKRCHCRVNSGRIGPSRAVPSPVSTNPKCINPADGETLIRSAIQPPPKFFPLSSIQEFVPCPEKPYLFSSSLHCSRAVAARLLQHPAVLRRLRLPFRYVERS